jgi:hypothetical protein
MIAYFRAIRPTWLSWRQDSPLSECTSGNCLVERRVCATERQRVRLIDPALHRIFNEVCSDI